MSASKPARELRVLLRRDSLGQVFSEVVDMNNPHRWTGEPSGVVIDRVRGRQLSIETVKMRAQSLADLLAVPLDEDLAWPCVAHRKQPCRCPRCIERGGS